MPQILVHSEVKIDAQVRREIGIDSIGYRPLPAALQATAQPSLYFAGTLAAILPPETKMNPSFNHRLVALFGAILFVAAATAAPVDNALRTIQNPGGGRVVYGQLSGPLTPQAAMGEMLHRVGAYCGDRPQLGRLLQNHTGEILAAFFTVTAKNQDGRQLAGLVIVSTPKTGNAGAAVLSDYADRFPSTANSLFALLKQQISASPSSASTPNQQSAGASAAIASPSGPSSPPAPAAPPARAQVLQATRFPDGSGVIGLPAGWTLVRAQLGDITAKGPRGEMLRFGLTISVIDPTNPQSRTLMGNNNPGAAPGNFVSIPFATDPATAFKSGAAQLAQKRGKQAPAINITKVQEIPMQGGKNYFLYGDIDPHDGQGAQSLVAQLIMAPPQQMGAWQMTIFQLQAPAKIMAEERTTLSAIFPSYSRDSNFVNKVVNDQIRIGIEQTNQFVGEVQRHMDDSDRFTAGFSDFLRNQTVIVDTETGGHARTSDDFADMLQRANPNRFEAVPTSQYIKGIDY
jgi:hypothetical protein